jgi:hypothetical protein
MSNSDYMAAASKHPELTRLQTELPRVYDYVLEHIDERARPEPTWHLDFALDIVDKLNLPDPYENTVLICKAVRIAAHERYGSLYPESTAPRAANVSS